MTLLEMTDAQYDAWENRLRRQARAQGLKLQRSRSRTFLANDYGRYMLIDVNTNSIAAGDFTYGGLSLDQVAAALAP